MLSITQDALKALAAAGGYGDLNEFPTDALTELLNKRLARIIPVTEAGMNIRLTSFGRKVTRIL